MRYAPAAMSPVKNASEIEAWLRREVSSLVGIPEDEVNINEEFASFGLGSVQSVTLAGELQEFLGFRLSATLVWDFPTVGSMAKHLAELSLENEGQA